MKELSHEQLLEQIKRLEARATGLEKANARLERKTQDLKERLETARRAKEGAEQEAKNLRRQNAILQNLKKEMTPVIAKVAELLEAHLTDDATLNVALLRDFLAFVQQFDAARNGRSVLLNKCPGTEKISPASENENKDAEKELKKATDRLSRSAIHQQANSQLVMTAQQAALATVEPSAETDSVASIMADVNAREFSDAAKEARQAAEAASTPHGRQTVNRDMPEHVCPPADIPEGLTCPHCGGTKFHTVEQDSTPKLIGSLQHLVDLMKITVQKVRLAECAQCHTVQPVFDDNTPMALNPKREMTIDTLVAIADCVASGIPLNKVTALFFQTLQLGSSTASENLHQLAMYATPLMKQIEKQAHKESVIAADETRFDILQVQNRGHQKKATEEAPAEEQQETGSATYMQAICSIEGSDTPFALFYPMSGRSAAKIGEVLAPFNPSCIVTDAYAAYGTIVRQLKQNVGHGTCWIHLRRKVMEAADLKTQAIAISKDSPEATLKRYTEHLEKETPTAILNGILAAMSRMFAEDKVVTRREGEDRADWLNRVKEHRKKYVGWYADQIDTLFEKLRGQASLEEKGTKYCAGAGAPSFTEPLVYYLNSRTELRYFLEHPECPLHTNEVERSIRTLAIIRRNSNFLQNMDYARSLCRLVSLYETAKKNGIVNPGQWLRTYYYRLAKHCQREQWVAHTKPGAKPPKDPNKTFVSWDYELYWDSMELEDLLPWNYVEK